MRDLVKIVSTILLLGSWSQATAQSTLVGISAEQVGAFVFTPVSDAFPMIRQQIQVVAAVEEKVPLVLPPTILLQPQAQPGIYNFEHLAFFCKIEVQLEKANNFPVKFRLGDVNYVDNLEGKGF